MIQRPFASLALCLPFTLTAALSAQSGQVLEFDGADDRVTVAAGPALDVADTYTLEAWVRPDSIGAYHAILGRGAGFAPQQNILFLVWNDGRLALTHGTSAWVISNTVLPAGVWSHAAVVKSPGGYQFYLNGVADGGGAHPGAPLTPGTYPLVIGKQGAQGNEFDGRLDDVRLWRTARSQAQIQSAMALLLNPGSQSDLVAYYRFEGAGQTVTDSSNNALHGFLGTDASVEATDPSRIAPPPLASECIVASGYPVGIAPAIITGANPIGFAFPIDGGTYTDIHVSERGVGWFSNSGTPSPPPSQAAHTNPSPANLVAHGPVVAPLWTHSISSLVGDVYVDASATRCIVTWKDFTSVGHPTPHFSFQMVLFPNGDVEFRYDHNCTNNSLWFAALMQGVVGISGGSPNVLPASSDFELDPSSAGDPTLFEHWPVANTFDMAGGTLLLVATNPGYQAIYTADGAGCAKATSYGTGCAGLTLTSNAPIIGGNWDLTTAGLTISDAITFFASSALANPIPMPNIGINSPGCSVHLNGLLGSLTAPNVTGTATLTIAVPNNPTLKGSILNAQSVALDLSLPSLLATSNGLEGWVGY